MVIDFQAQLTSSLEISIMDTLGAMQWPQDLKLTYGIINIDYRTCEVRGQHHKHNPF